MRHILFGLACACLSTLLACTTIADLPQPDLLPDTHGEDLPADAPQDLIENLDQVDPPDSPTPDLTELADTPVADSAPDAVAPDALDTEELGPDLTDLTDTALPTPSVRFLSPANGAHLPNPVTFTFEAHHVATVQILADAWPLAPAPWDPATSASLTYTFSGTGYERTIRLLGHDGTGAVVAEDSLQITVTAPLGPGTSIGTFYNTYYYLANEADYTGAPSANLYAPDCSVIAVVSSSFANSACIEGSAILKDGRVINYHSPCACGGPCSYCWSVLDKNKFPWGKGSRNNPLEPLRSWAVDTSVITHGTILYVEEWDGLNLPAVDGLGGAPHDGCFRADDVGGGITGKHVDIFAGTKAMWRELEKIFPTRTNFTVYIDSPRCQHL